MRAARRNAIAAAVGYEFKDVGLLSCALTHPSRRSDLGLSYERLEFLGDAVLGLIIADHLYRICPERDEGELTKMKSAVVSGRTLARIARQVGLDAHIEVDKGIAAQKRLPTSVLSDAIEAIIGAIYIESGLDEARRVILELLREPLEDAVSRRTELDYKSRLQEWAHGALGQTPTYKVLDEKGPDHTKRFLAGVVIGGKEYGRAWGPNKRTAEQAAACATLQELGVIPADDSTGGEDGASSGD